MTANGSLDARLADECCRAARAIEVARALLDEARKAQERARTIRRTLAAAHPCGSARSVSRWLAIDLHPACAVPILVAAVGCLLFAPCSAAGHRQLLES